MKLFLFSLFLFSLNGFTQSFQWGVSGGGINGMSLDDSEQINEIVTDGFGNVYGITPVSNNGLMINGAYKPDYQGAGAGDISRRSALVSYGCDGAFRWSKIIGSVSGTKINAVKIDSNNNVYISGSTWRQQTTYFDNVASPPYASVPCSYTSSGGITTYQGCKEFFIAKYDTNGNLLWITYPEGTYSFNTNNNTFKFNNGEGYILDIDENNNLFMMCSLCEGTFCNGAYTNNVIGENVYGINDATVSRHILKFNSDGQFVEGYPFTNMPLAQFQMSKQKAFRSKNTGNIYFISHVASNITTFAMVNGEPINKPKNLFAFNAQGQFLWRV